MSRSKKIFFLVAILFFLLLLYVAYDFSTRTTFPGAHKRTGANAPQTPDSLPSDTVTTDTL
ncbi:MAG TPA: hypothetical protein VF490_14515 [Chryseosolibacter sp.]